MGKIIQIEVPDWLDEKLIRYIQEVIKERIDDILIDAIWNKSLEGSNILEEDIEKLSEEIKQSAWKKLKEDLKEKGLIDD